ncbi:STE3-domain-containing protein [Favolaschia claudopus]|uniref:STE3-domain-containing protein n=1 Tax=Favolaschia claudopus TaxID=2862362 RepID=A0AAV9ZMN1_9AGAR
MVRLHPELVPIAFIAAFSLFLALPCHWRARNVATLSAIFWLFIANIIFAVDSIIWGDSIRVIAPIWCDISTKLIIGSNFALPAACLCICIHLEQVSSIRAVRVTIDDKKRRQLFEALMCFGLPLVFMALHYVVQGHRFDIIQEYGCRPATFISIPAIFIVWIPPMILAIAALVFAGLALRHFMVRRISFAAHLDASHSALTTSRYLRLMLMSMTQMIWSLSVTTYNLWFTFMNTHLRPWTSWSDVHADFLRVDQFPTLFLSPLVQRAYYAVWWAIPASTFIFVLFFAFGREALDDYKHAFGWILRVIFRRKPAPATLGTSSTSKHLRQLKLPSITNSTKEQPPTPLSSFPPSYRIPTPPTPTKFSAQFDEVSFGDVSETSSRFGPALSYEPPSESVITLASATELEEGSAPSTASTLAFVQPLQHAVPLPPLPRGTRPSNSRPLTYPSYDRARRGGS